jgi:sulfate adenylyltransferase
MVPFRNLVYVENLDTYMPDDEVPTDARVLAISGTQLRRRLATGAAIPPWFTFPDVAEQLRRTHPPRERQGITIFFTGLSGSGKSTVANVLLVKLLASGGRGVTLLDGDVVRKHLSSELGFSKAHRDLNIRRIGYVAAEITRHGGIAICAPIAPYADVRREVREAIEPHGAFVLVHLATSLDVCEARDRKGLYAKARAGLLPQFTGVSDPYETPTDAALVIDTAVTSAEDAAAIILQHLASEGYLATVSNSLSPSDAGYRRAAGPHSGDPAGVS